MEFLPNYVGIFILHYVSLFEEMVFMKRIVIISLCFLLFSTAVVHSQTVTVNEIRNLPQDSWVILRGNIVNVWADSYYTFRDSTGEILVEISNSVWRGLSANTSDIVEIRGEVRISSGQTSIRVRAITGSGEVIHVPGQGVMVNQTITVSEVRALPQNSWVTINGNIISSLPGGNRFNFRDSSGDISIEIERSVWRGLSVGASDRVEISGEVRINNRQVSIRVRAIRRI